MKPESNKAISRYLFPAIDSNPYVAKVFTVWLVLCAVVMVVMALFIIRRF